MLVPRVMARCKEGNGATKARATVRLAVGVAGVARLVEEEDPSALAVAGTMEQTARTSGAMEANQTAIFAKAHGLEREDRSALAVAGTMGQTAQTSGVTGANQTAMFALGHGLEVALRLHHQAPHLPLVVQRQLPPPASGTVLEELVLVPLSEGVNQCIATAMQCLLPLQTIHMVLSFMELLQSLPAWEGEIGWLMHVANAGRLLLQAMHQDTQE